jgi:hypothetical protein
MRPQMRPVLCLVRAHSLCERQQRKCGIRENARENALYERILSAASLVNAFSRLVRAHSLVLPRAYCLVYCLLYCRKCMLLLQKKITVPPTASRTVS